MLKQILASPINFEVNLIKYINEDFEVKVLKIIVLLYWFYTISNAYPMLLLIFFLEAWDTIYDNAST